MYENKEREREREREEEGNTTLLILIKFSTLSEKYYEVVGYG